MRPVPLDLVQNLEAEALARATAARWIRRSLKIDAAVADVTGDPHVRAPLHLREAIERIAAELESPTARCDFAGLEATVDGLTVRIHTEGGPEGEAGAQALQRALELILETVRPTPEVLF